MGRAAQLVRMHENYTRNEYTHVVVARPDIAFLSPLQWAPLQNAIRVPNFAMNGGVNDRFAYGPTALMLEGFLSQFDKQFTRRGFRFDTNSEGLLCRHFREQHLHVSVTPLCLVRVRGLAGIFESIDHSAKRETPRACLGAEQYSPWGLQSSVLCILQKK